MATTEPSLDLAKGPSAEEVVSLASALKERLRTRDKIITDIRDLRFMRKKVKIPDAYKATATEVRVPIINDQISRLVAALTVNPPVFSVPAVAPGPRAQERASKLELSAKQLFYELTGHKPQRFFRRMADKAVADGVCALKLIHKKDAWDARPRRTDKTEKDDPDWQNDEENKRFLENLRKYKIEAGVPLKLSIVDALSYYPIMDDDDKPQAVVEITTRRISEVKAHFKPEEYEPALAAIYAGPNTYNDLSSGNRDKAVLLIEHWDNQWVTYVLAHTTALSSSPDIGIRGGHIIRQFKNPYGWIPYHEVRGEETGTDDENFQGMSSAFPMMYLAELMNSMLTQFNHLGHMTSYATFVDEPELNAQAAPTNEDSDEEGGSKVDFVLGSIIEMEPGHRLRPLEFGSLAGPFTGMLTQVKEMMQSSALPSIMQGVPPGSRTAGFAISELSAAAKSKYQIIVENMQTGLAEMMNAAFKMIEKVIKEDIYLLESQDAKQAKKLPDFYSLGPDDIKGYYAVEVQIRPRNPVDKIQEANHLMNMHNGGAAPLRMVIEDGMGYEQPDEVLKEMMVESMMSDPDVLNFLKQEAFREAGMDRIIADIQAMTQTFQSSMEGARAMAGGQGMGAGQTQPGVFNPPGPPAGMQMELPGMGALPGAGGPMQNPMGVPSEPRIYSPKGGPKLPGVPATPPNRGMGIEGFRGRG